MSSSSWIYTMDWISLRLRHVCAGRAVVGNFSLCLRLLSATSASFSCATGSPVSRVSFLNFPPPEEAMCISQFTVWSTPSVQEGRSLGLCRSLGRRRRGTGALQTFQRASWISLKKASPRFSDVNDSWGALVLQGVNRKKSWWLAIPSSSIPACALVLQLESTGLYLFSLLFVACGYLNLGLSRPPIYV